MLVYNVDIEFSYKDSNSIKRLKGSFKDKVQIAEEKVITTPSGSGGIITHRCTQWITVDKYLVKVGDRIYVVDPIDVINI